MTQLELRLENRRKSTPTSKANHQKRAARSQLFLESIPFMRTLFTSRRVSAMTKPKGACGKQNRPIVRRYVDINTGKLSERVEVPCKTDTGKRTRGRPRVFKLGSAESERTKSQSARAKRHPSATKAPKAPPVPPPPLPLERRRKRVVLSKERRAEKTKRERETRVRRRIAQLKNQGERIKHVDRQTGKVNEVYRIKNRSDENGRVTRGRPRLIKPARTELGCQKCRYVPIGCSKCRQEVEETKRLPFIVASQLVSLNSQKPLQKIWT
jgi:hypothetical protein